LGAVEGRGFKNEWGDRLPKSVLLGLK